MTRAPSAHIPRTGDETNVTSRDAGKQKRKNTGEHCQALLEGALGERMLGSDTDKKEPVSAPGVGRECVASWESEETGWVPAFVEGLLDVRHLANIISFHPQHNPLE